MLKSSLKLTLPVLAALGVACGRDLGFDPGPRVLTGLEVTPTYAALSTVAPGNTLQLSLWPYDQTGARMSATGAVSYSSGAPAIVEVSGSGVVTAAAPGTARVTAVLTLGGVTRTASMIVTVHMYDYSDIAGVYDLTARVTSFDPAWGYDLTGYRYTAVLTVHEAAGPSELGGTLADLQLIGPSGDATQIATTGTVTSSVDPHGRLSMELFSDGSHGNRFTLTLGVATLAAGFIDGDFGHAHIGGTFTATRRPQ